MHRKNEFPDGLPTSPTGRVPQWVLDEVSNALPPAEPWRSWTPAEPPRPARRRRNWTGVGGAMLVVALVGIAVVGTHLGVLPGPPALGATAAGNGPGWPSPGVEEEDEPLGTPVVAPPGAGGYGFTSFQTDGVTPVAYDPCRPIHYVVRPGNTPLVVLADGTRFEGETIIQDAVARISAVTGLQFVNDGSTDENPSDDREPFQPDRYGDRWAPVLIAWESVDEQPDFAADVAGLGGSLPVSVGNGPKVYVTGSVELDSMQFVHILSQPGGLANARAIVLHELGHVLGLAHVDDPTQLMYPQGQPGVVDFGAGDLTGLAQLGAGGCVPEL